MRFILFAQTFNSFGVKKENTMVQDLSEIDIEDIMEKPLLDDYMDFVEGMWIPSKYDDVISIRMDTARIIDMLRTNAGIQEEAGELSGKIKKFFRGDFGSTLPVEDIKAEMGDLMFYLFHMMKLCGIKPEDVFYGNIDKLLDRKERGVIQGSGDHR